MGTATKKNRLLPCALALAGALMLWGCNKLRLGYEYADWLIVYSLEDNFDLDKHQRNRIKEDVGAYFRWHRKALLPLYADLLLRVGDSLKMGLDPADIDSAYLEYRSLYRKTMEPVVDGAVSLLSSLTPAQIDVWEERQKKKIAKLRKDFSGEPKEKLEWRYRKIVDELEDWTSRLSADQKRQIRALSFSLPWNGDLWLAKREAMHTRLSGLMRQPESNEALRKFLADYYLRPERLRSDEYNARYREYERKAKAMIPKVYAILTADQKKHLLAEVDKLGQSLHHMARQE